MSARARAARWSALALVVAGGVAPTACGDVIAQPIGDAPGDGGVAPNDASLDTRSADGGAGSDAPATGEASDDDATGIGGDAASFCSGHGPTLPGLPSGTTLCAGDLANLFRFAACSCTAFDVSGVLTTSAIDSQSDAGVPAGSIGANQAVSTNSTTTIQGSLWAGGQGVMGGAPAVFLAGASPGSIARDVQSGGPVEVAGPYEIVGDLWSNGNVTVDSTGSLTVDGTVHVPPGDTATGVTTSGGVATTSVNVAPPCDCSKLTATDIGAIVDGFANPANNDDAAQGLSTTALDQSGTVTLGCGLYWVDGIHGGDITLKIDGRVALFVGGDVSIDQGLTIQFVSGELDLFVKGNVSLQSATQSLVVGDVTSPARTRLYVAGMGNDAGGGFTVSASATIAANVYAPSAVVQLASNFDMRGAILAQALQFSGDFAITYDTAILQVPASSGCQPGGGSCTSCNDCAGATPACIGGTCAPCLVTSDCCAPLECAHDGRCVQPVQ